MHCDRKVIGYARVSTEEQSLALQLDALHIAGCDRICTDHGISGSQFCRPGLKEALALLEPGDKLIVWRLDRLGRSLIDLVQLLDYLGCRGIAFRSLNEQIDTSSAGGRLIFHIMAALAEFERSLISERTRAGMAAARAHGKHIGRRPSLTLEQRREAHLLIKQQGFSAKEVADRYHVGVRTLLRWVTEWQG